MVCELLLEESNVHYVSTPVTVCGDIHGQVMIILLACFYTDYVTAFNFVFHSFMTLKSCLELLQSGDTHPVVDTEGKIPRQDHLAAWQP